MGPPSMSVDGRGRAALLALSVFGCFLLFGTRENGRLQRGAMQTRMSSRILPVRLAVQPKFRPSLRNPEIDCFAAKKKKKDADDDEEDDFSMPAMRQPSPEEQKMEDAARKFINELDEQNKEDPIEIQDKFMLDTIKATEYGEKLFIEVKDGETDVKPSLPTKKNIMARAEEIANTVELSDLESNHRKMLTSLFPKDLEGNVVLVRADLNVPLKEDSDEIEDDQRIKAALDTVKYLMEKGAKVLVIGHLERYTSSGLRQNTLAPVAARMSELLNEVVTFVADCGGEKVANVARKMTPGSVALLENVRLVRTGDEEMDDALARELASLADIFVMDDFTDAHLNMASTVGVAKHASIAVGGLLVEKEMKYVDGAIQKPQRPFAAIVGGARLSEKYEMINRLLDKVDGIFIGGAVANTFIMSRGHKMGDSLNEPDQYKMARKLELKARNRGVKLMLPEDFLFANGYETDALTSSITMKSIEQPGNIPSGWMAMDFGEATLTKMVAVFKTAKTVFWNGPISAEEIESFSFGSHCVGSFMSAMSKANRTTIAGGRDTVAALGRCGAQDKLVHVSTGARSFMDLLEGKILPGLNALDPPEEIKIPLPDVTENKPLFDMELD